MKFTKKPVPRGHLFALIVMFLVVSCSGSSEEAPVTEKDAPIKALLITGGGWHDYETQEGLLTEGISERVNVEWTISHEGDGDPEHHVSILKEDNWAADYDVVVHNSGFGRVTDPDFVKHFVEHHKGTPAVLIHAAVHSYRYAEPADPWFEFMGIQSMRHESQRKIPIETVASGNPIIQSFPEKWETPVDDELYVIEEVRGDITTLLQGYGEETEEFHPVAWTKEDKETRIFSTTLGHNNDMYRQKEFLDMVASGLLWAVEKNN